MSDLPLDEQILSNEADRAISDLQDDAIRESEEIERLTDALDSLPMNGCDKCDESGGAKTYANQACLPINGKVRCIDWCIHQIVAALNAGGVETVASCCGHGKQDGRIDLADGRILTISGTRT